MIVPVILLVILLVILAILVAATLSASPPRRILYEVIDIRRALVPSLRPLPAPGPTLPRLLAETTVGDVDMLVYQAQFPALDSSDPNNKDVKQQHFVAKVGDQVLLDQVLDVSATTSGEFKCAEGDSVVMSLAYLDDATPPNEGAASTQTFIAHDTIPPDAPGPFGAVTLLREEPDA